jgi:REP element-mobilizing transposase RayT
VPIQVQRTLNAPSFSSEICAVFRAIGCLPFVMNMGGIMRGLHQGRLEFKSWGGARKGAGRKCEGKRSRVAHSKRAALKPSYPTHITLRIEDGLNNLRNRIEYATVREALVAGANRFGMRLVEFAVLSNHLHLVCEAYDERALARGMKGLCVRIARALNRLWNRVGSVFSDRYHAHVLKTPRGVRHALNYVLHNAAKHGDRLGGPDPCSSGAWFDGWRHDLGPKRVAPASPSPHALTQLAPTSPLPRALTWLLRVGWRRHGYLDPVPPPFTRRERED